MFNLAQQRDRSDFNGKVSLRRLADLHWTAFSVSFKNLRGGTRKTEKRLLQDALKTTEEDTQEEATTSWKQWPLLTRLARTSL